MDYQHDFRGLPEVFIKAPYSVEAALKLYPGGKKKRIAVQAGGYVGVWPQYLSRFFDCVVTFEPVARHWVYMNTTITAKNVMKVYGGLGSSCVMASSSIQPDKISGSASVVDFSPTLTPVPIYTLDSFLPEYMKSQVDSIFLDTEGTELEILRGAVSVLINKPLIVVEENQRAVRRGVSVGSIERFLADYGYKKIGNYSSDFIYAVQ